MKKYFPSSELIINEDGSVFHLHVKPEWLADKVILVGDPRQNEKIEQFEYQGMHITNFEMESSALAGLSRLLGHKATTVCMVIANRLIKEANTGYKNTIDTLIQTVLDRI